MNRKQVEFYTHLQMSLFWTPPLRALVQEIWPPRVTLKISPRLDPVLKKKNLTPVEVVFSAVFP
jgi:hypothetical protein